MRQDHADGRCLERFVIIINQRSYNNYMTDTTSIMDLPTDAAGGGSIGGNISFSANEKSFSQEESASQNTSGVSLDKTTINQIISGLQQASGAGLTQLQSRDIPLNSNQITQDPQVQPNYIPPPQKLEDYIQNHEDNDVIVQNYGKRKALTSKLDETYDEIQMPLLVTVLYFLFQMPILQRVMYKYAPALFTKDGNSNVYGLLFMSTTFGIVYYILSKTRLL